MFKNSSFPTIRIIAKQFVLQQIQSRGFYWVLFLVSVLLITSVNNLIKVVNTGYVSVMSSPFNLPAISADLFISIYLTFSIAGTIVREKEFGILETLFWSPVSYFEYLLGTTLGCFLTGALMSLVSLIIAILFSVLTGFSFSLNIILITVYVFVASLPFIGLGTLIAASSKTTRAAFLTILFIFFVFFTFSVSEMVLVLLVSESNYSSIVVIRDFMSGINGVLGWISPIEYYFDGINALFSHSFGIVWIRGVLCLVFFAVCFALSWNRFIKKGILQ